MKLVRGGPSSKQGVPWLAAINWLMNSNKPDFLFWLGTVNVECVDPVIHGLGAALNDWCEDGEREQLIGPHLFSIVGTRIDHGLTVRRSFRCADWAVREIAPLALEQYGHQDAADRLRALSAITDERSAVLAQSAFPVIPPEITLPDHPDTSAWTVAYRLIDAARRVAGEAPGGPQLPNDFNFPRESLNAETWEEAVAELATMTAKRVPAVEGNKQRLLGLIIELCSMGSQPVTEACSREEILRRLNCEDQSRAWLAHHRSAATGTHQVTKSEAGSAGTEATPHGNTTLASKISTSAVLLAIQSLCLFSVFEFLAWWRIPDAIAGAPSLRWTRYSAYFQILYWVVGYFFATYHIAVGICQEAPERGDRIRNVVGGFSIRDVQDVWIQLVLVWPIIVLLSLFVWPTFGIIMFWHTPKRIAAATESSANP